MKKAIACLLFFLLAGCVGGAFLQANHSGENAGNCLADEIHTVGSGELRVACSHTAFALYAILKLGECIAPAGTVKSPDAHGNSSVFSKVAVSPQHDAGNAAPFCRSKSHIVSVPIFLKNGVFRL